MVDWITIERKKARRKELSVANIHLESILRRRIDIHIEGHTYDSTTRHDVGQQYQGEWCIHV